MDQQDKLVARPLLKDKWWVLEKNGDTVGNISQSEMGLVLTYTRSPSERFTSKSALKKKYNIVFSPSPKKAKLKDVHGYPCAGTPHNPLWDVKRGVPLYTKTEKSKSMFCAGWYQVKKGKTWSTVYCPKAIILERRDWKGPYKNESEAGSWF